MHNIFYREMTTKIKCIELLCECDNNFKKEEGIDDESFLLLDEETIRYIFIKSGPRLKFLQYYKSHLAKQNQHRFVSNDTTLTVTTDTDSGSVATATESNYSFQPDEELVAAIENVDGVFFPENTLNQNMLPSVQMNKRPLEENTDLLNKKFKTESIFHDGLQSLLQKSAEGQIVLYNKHKLTNDHRQKLTKIIITELTGVYGINLKGTIFDKAAEEITRIFTCEEKDTYFIPSSDGGPKGKLWYRYVNVRAALKIANTHQKVEKKSLSPVTDEQQAYIDFLKIATEPFSKVLEFWEVTYKTRRRTYMNCSLSQIFSDFPCLKLEKGIELIETDFHKKFPDKIDIIYATLPKVVHAILKEANERKIKVVNSECPDEVLRALLCLPYLFPPTTLRKSRKGGGWRPSRTEIVESFFTPLENYEDLDVRHKSRKTKLESHELTLQPYIAVVGQLLTPEFYVVIDENIRYNIKSSIRALETAFKLFHALDVEYPPESEHIWLLFEDMVFKMKPKKKNPCTASVISDLNYHLKDLNDSRND